MCGASALPYPRLVNLIYIFFIFISITAATAFFVV